MTYIRNTGMLHHRRWYQNVPPHLNYAGDERLMHVHISLAIEVIEFVKSKRSKRTGLPIEIRFSSEDSFRSNLVDLLTIYSAVNDVGVNRVGIADTVGW